MKPFEITSIQRGCVYDGEGVRTTVFLRGCPFSCPWCCNPETLSSSRTCFIDEEKCLLKKGVESPLCNDCVRKGGGVSLEHCPFGVSEPTYRSYTLEELLTMFMRDKSLYQISGGGITFSGGDPIVRVAELLPLFQALHKEGISCDIETTFYIKDESSIRKCLPLINEWIVDLKLQPVNFRKDYDDIMLHNLTMLREAGAKTLYRLVYVETMEAKETIARLKKLQVKKLQLIKCHALAETKYRKLSLPFRSYVPSDEAYEAFLAAIIKDGVEAERLMV